MGRGTIASMANDRSAQWIEGASAALSEAGYRMGAARRAVLAFLAEQPCAVTAREVGEALEARDEPVGRASVFRVLEQLDALGLVQRVELGHGVARFEPRWPDGEHHHHLVCDRCGRILPFHDDALERAIAGVGRRAGAFDVSAHEVTLRGACETCRSQA